MQSKVGVSSQQPRPSQTNPPKPLKSIQLLKRDRGGRNVTVFICRDLFLILRALCVNHAGDKAEREAAA